MNIKKKKGDEKPVCLSMFMHTNKCWMQAAGGYLPWPGNHELLKANLLPLNHMPVGWKQKKKIHSLNVLLLKIWKMGRLYNEDQYSFLRV